MTSDQRPHQCRIRHSSRPSLRDDGHGQTCSRQSSKHPNSYLSTMTVLTSLFVIVAVMLSSSSFLDGVAAFSFSSPSISSSRLSMMSGGGGRSPLAQQYKNVQSIRGGVLSGSGYPRLAPPGEPEPEVRA